MNPSPAIGAFACLALAPDFKFGKSNSKEMDAFLNAGLIIVDEISMVNIELMHSLLNTLSPHSALLLVGDVDQLPAIGAGNVLSDILKSR